MDFENVHTNHEIDQTLAEGLELGMIHVVGKTDSGDDLMALTAKGICLAALLSIQSQIDQANEQKRDFTAEEKADLHEHVTAMLKALEKET
ncbi:MAG: hypothetical protein ACRDHW_00295 [Ktedonobacteraceae bacterium]